MGEPDVPAWPRPQFVAGGGDAALHYVVFGEFDLSVPADLTRYRLSRDAPYPLLRFDAADRPEALASFRRGLAWQLLQQEQPDLAALVLAAPTCLVLRADVPDPPSLDYLRDAVGFVGHLLDRGGAAVYDPFALRWWGADAWWQTVFAADQPEPKAHVSILVSEPLGEGTGRWFHTRGMRKFGRPDLSVREVPRDLEGPMVDLLQRFILWQILGTVVAEGQEVVVAGLPEGLTCHHRGALDDPDFENVHLEIRWPGDPDSGPREKAGEDGDSDAPA